MSFEDLLAQARNAYHAAFVQFIAALRRSGRSFAAEVLVQPNGWTSPPPFNLMRVDALVGEGDDFGMQQLVDGPGPEISPREHTLDNGLRVVAGVVGWEAFTVAFSSPPFHVAMLSEWLGRWLDVAEAHGEDESGVSGVAHGIAWESEEEHWRLTVDLGTAPVEAAHELLGVLAANGVARCEILPPSPPQS